MIQQIVLFIVHFRRLSDLCLLQTQCVRLTYLLSTADKYSVVDFLIYCLLQTNEDSVVNCLIYCLLQTNVDSVVDCHLSCNKMDGQCNAYKYDADTEICSAAKVTNFLILKDFWKMLFNDLS